jgi:hypothetical protein
MPTSFDRLLESQRLSRYVESVDTCIVCLHLQCTVQLSIMGQQLNNVGQCDFDVVIDGTRSGTRHGADEGRKFVVDPVDQLVQQNAFYRDSWCEGETPSLNAPIQHFDRPRARISEFVKNFAEPRAGRCH